MTKEIIEEIKKEILTICHDPIRNRMGIKASFRWLNHSVFQFIENYPGDRGIVVLISVTNYYKEDKLKTEEQLIKQLLRAGISKAIEVANTRDTKVVGDD